MEDIKREKTAHAEREEKILSFWDENDIFRKTLEKPSKGEFVFYEGPPTANGKPGIHHVEARSFKDVIPRYKTMQGFHVRRKAGWDTHGLPVELEVEKKLGLKSKKEIEEYGIEAFNKKCKESVFEYIDLWKEFTKRIGYWTDFDTAYFTFHNTYIESLWNIVGKINNDKLLYKDYKVVPWCTRCGTTLSSHEIAQGYQDVKDLTVYVKFQITNDKSQTNSSDQNLKTYILAWTTTPWTLPGNVALAVGKDIEYIKVKSQKLKVESEKPEVKDEEILIVAKEKVSSLFVEGQYEILGTMKGSDLVGLSYEPLFPYLKDNLPESEKPKLENAFKIYAGDFVTTTDGTGVVHIAPMYGQDDFELGTKNTLPKYHIVDQAGQFISSCDFLANRFVKEVDEKGKPLVAVDIINYLKERNLFFKQENYAHSYPHCWRCKTPLIYYARDSWYIGMSKLREKLVAENEHINWEPSYIKEGRFGEWLREIRDWAISRERYWGTPLPIWLSEDKSEMLVVDSIDTLKKHTKKSGNNYRLIRHGKTDANAKGVFDITTNNPLSEEGRELVQKSLENLKTQNYKPDLIIASPFNRTKETSEILAEGFGIPKADIVFDDRIVEWNISRDFDGESFDVLFAKIDKEGGDNIHTHAFPNGESYADVVKRMGEFFYEIENKYKDKNILIVSHAGPLKALYVVAGGLDIKQIADYHRTFQKIDNAESRVIDFVPLPHNENYELDLHKPFIDSVSLVSEKGTSLTRIKEVMDVWFDSGAMPFAQDHYPFENKEFVDTKSFPADYISEAIDQTRGWFYTLHAVGVLMGKGNAYKNVICLGHLLDKNGKKMSKSLGNVVNPWEQMDKFGIDAIRLWMYSVNQPGESKNYDEKTVDEINKKVFNLVTNVQTFYELYRDKELEKDMNVSTKNVMDLWILDRLNSLVTDVTKAMDEYKILEPVRGIRDFIDSLSTWYLQLSRDRFRDGDDDAKKTLYVVLKTLAKVMAPFAPFYSEHLYLNLRNEKDVESVHLENWPEEVESEKLKVESRGNEMQLTRTIVSLGLDARMKANSKVRQPLSQLKVKSDKLKVGEEFVTLIKERLNVKDISFVEMENDVELDLNITSELKEEGVVREIIRAVQDMRKQQGLTPHDKIVLTIFANENGKDVLEKSEWLMMIRDAVLAKNIEVKSLEGEGVMKIDDIEVAISLL